MINKRQYDTNWSYWDNRYSITGIWFSDGARMIKMNFNAVWPR